MKHRTDSDIQTRRLSLLSIIERTRTEEGFFGGSLNPKHAVISKLDFEPKSSPSHDALALLIFDKLRAQYHSRKPLHVRPTLHS